jgi:hypothetical protein
MNTKKERARDISGDRVYTYWLTHASNNWKKENGLVHTAREETMFIDDVVGCYCVELAIHTCDQQRRNSFVEDWEWRIPQLNFDYRVNSHGELCLRESCECGSKNKPWERFWRSRYTFSIGRIHSPRFDTGKHKRTFTGHQCDSWWKKHYLSMKVRQSVRKRTMPDYQILDRSHCESTGKDSSSLIVANNSNPTGG